MEPRMIDWDHARQLWRDGLDTFDIARHFGVQESEIYNGFAQGRSEHEVPAPEHVRMQDCVRDERGLHKRQEAPVARPNGA